MSVNMDKFFAHSLPRFFSNYDYLNHTVEFGIKHPTREITLTYTQKFTMEELLALTDMKASESITNDDMALSKGFTILTIKLMEEYLAMLRRKEPLDAPKTSDVLRFLIAGNKQGILDVKEASE